MFDQLFVRSDALTRYLSAPLVDERCQYLAHRAVQGMAKSTLDAKARLLLSIAEYMRLADRPSDKITPSEIKKAATVLVQPELERGRPPLVSIPPLQAHCSSNTSVRLNFRMARNPTDARLGRDFQSLCAGAEQWNSVQIALHCLTRKGICCWCRAGEYVGCVNYANTGQPRDLIFGMKAMGWDWRQQCTRGQGNYIMGWDWRQQCTRGQGNYISAAECAGGLNTDG